MPLRPFVSCRRSPRNGGLDRRAPPWYTFAERLVNERVRTLSDHAPNMRQERAAETRRRLLAAALTLFAERGYNGTPVRAINRSIGMADGLLYHYFPGGKREMLRVMVHENLVQVMNCLQRRNVGLESLPIADMLERLFQNISDVFEEHQEILRILMKESEIIEMLELKQLVQTIRKEQSRLPGLLAARASAGEIRAMDYQSAAEVLLAVMMHHLLSRLTGLSAGQLHDPEKRRSLIAYQVSLWKNS